MKRLAATFTVLVALGAGGALAQSGISGIVSKSGLSPEDLTIMGEKAYSLYAGPHPKAGESVQWVNPNSKSFGTTLLTGFAKGCATIEQVSHPKGQEQTFTYNTRHCKNSEGKWVLQP